MKNQRRGFAPIIIFIIVVALIGVGVFVFRERKHVVLTAGNTQATTTPHVELKKIAITFDDGPYGTTTSEILDILEREKVQATFFLIGKNVEQHPDQVLREVKDGNIVGNHSYSHSRDLPIMSSSTLRADIQHDEDLIYQASGHRPHFFRAPYGSTTPQMIKEIEAEGYQLVEWDFDSADWHNDHASTTIISRVLSNAKPNIIILFHDGHEVGTDYSRQNLIEALPVIIHRLKREGYTFVTVDKILHTNPYK